MAITASEKLGLIKNMADDYMEFGGYSDDAKNSASLDQLLNCTWAVLLFKGSDGCQSADTAVSETP